MAKTKQTARKSTGRMSVAVAMRDHAYDAMTTLARYVERVEKEACAGSTVPEHFCFEREGELIPASDMVCHVWDKVDEMLQSIKAPNNVAGQKRERVEDPMSELNLSRLAKLRQAPITKLVAMTDAAARLGQDVVEQTAFAAWEALLHDADAEKRAQAQRLFDKEIGLPAPPLPGLGASQTTAGQVLDETLAAKKPKYAVLSADEGAAGPGGGKYAVLSAEKSANDPAREEYLKQISMDQEVYYNRANKVGDEEVKYRPAVVHENDEDVKYRPAVVHENDDEDVKYANLTAHEDEEAPRYAGLTA